MSRMKLAMVIGPTASGKTALAVRLAQRLNGEVISADSMQIYADMRIGTARPTAAEMQGIPHHLLGVLPLTQSYSVAQYTADANRCIADITARGRLPIVAGGTGLYVSSLADGLIFTETRCDESLRAELNRRAQTEGGEVLLRELAQFDPESAARLHPHNVGRIIRAIEIYRTSGITMTEQLRRSRANPPKWNLAMIGLTFRDRQKLYDRINRRVDQMLADGLEEEARRVLVQPGGATALQAIGYKELAPYLDGRCSRAEAVENLKKATRHYAKRQLTWFRRDDRIHWLELDQFRSEAEWTDEAVRTVERTFSEQEDA